MEEQKTIKFEIVTPERVVLKDSVLQASVPTTEGEITILPEHVPLVAMLQAGVIEVRRPSGLDAEVMSVSGGYVEVLKDKVVVLADTAEIARELDEERIKAARQKAEELKTRAKSSDQVSFTDVNTRIEKELARTRAIRRWKRLKNIK